MADRREERHCGEGRRESREESETDVGSQDLSELGGSLGASGVWASPIWHATGTGDMPGSSSRRGERSRGSPSMHRRSSFDQQRCYSLRPRREAHKYLKVAEVMRAANASSRLYIDIAK